MLSSLKAATWPRTVVSNVSTSYPNEVSLLVGAANLNRCLCLMLKMSGLVRPPTKSKINAGHRSIRDRIKTRLQGETISAESTFDAINCDSASSPAAIRLINVLRFNWPCASIGEVRHLLIHRVGTNHQLQFRKRNTRWSVPKRIRFARAQRTKSEPPHFDIVGKLIWLPKGAESRAIYHLLFSSSETCWSEKISSLARQKSMFIESSNIVIKQSDLNPIRTIRIHYRSKHYFL